MMTPILFIKDNSCLRGGRLFISKSCSKIAMENKRHVVMQIRISILCILLAGSALFPGVLFGAVVVNGSGDVFNIAAFRAGAPNTLLSHSFKLIPPKDSNGGNAAIDGNTVTIIYEGTEQLMTCDGVAHNIGSPISPEFQDTMTCSVSPTKDSIIASFIIHDQETFSASHELCPANELDASLKDTNESNPYCASDDNMDAKACKWQLQNMDDPFLNTKGVPVNAWVVYSRTTVNNLKASFSITATDPPYEESAKSCSYDTNNNGIIDEGEITQCVDTEQGLHCPLNQAICTSSQEPATCPNDTTLNTETDRCEKKISCTKGIFNSDTWRCESDAIASCSGIYDPNTGMCQMSTPVSPSYCPGDAPYIENLTYPSVIPVRMCLKVQTATYSCPNGGNLLGSYCYGNYNNGCSSPFSEHRITGEITCPNSYYLKVLYGGWRNDCVACRYIANATLSCPAGFETTRLHDPVIIMGNVLNSGIYCLKNPCPDGYNRVGDSCIIDTKVCDAGMSYDQTSGKCYVQPDNTSCPEGYSLSGDTCSAQPICPQDVQTPCECSQGTYNSNLLRCESPATCNQGTLQDGQCIQPVECPNGIGQFNASRTRCEITPTCKTGGTWNENIGLCSTSEDLCSGGVFNQQNVRCEAAVICPLQDQGAAFNPQTGLCEIARPTIVTDSCKAVRLEKLCAFRTCSGCGCSSFTEGITTARNSCPLNTPPDGWSYIGQINNCQNIIIASLCYENKYFGKIEYDSCPSPYTANGGVCQYTPGCPAVGYWIQDGMCVKYAECPESYNINPNVNRCTTSGECQEGWQLDPSTGRCFSTFSCPSQTTYSQELAACSQPAICETGMTPSGNYCVKPAYCPPNSSYIYDPTGDVCVSKNPDACPLGSEYSCKLYGGEWRCNNLPCEDFSSSVESSDTVEGANDKQDDGFEDDGSCKGEIYVFNGEDKRCRQRSIYTKFSNCCYMGESDECDKYILFGQQKCKAGESELACSRFKRLCVYVGEYCSMYQTFFGSKKCIQMKKTYCCYEDILSRVVHEQGRYQLKGFCPSGRDGCQPFGTGENPNCRGFTLEELQLLDFSQIDYSEIAEDIESRLPPEDQLKTKMQETVDNLYKSKVVPATNGQVTQ
jgi:hypothetical protein